jgi:flagellar FliL protein
MCAKISKDPKKPAPMPEATTAPAEPTAETPKKGLNLKLIIIVLAAMIIGGAGAFGAMKFLSSPKEPVVEAPPEDEFSETVTVETEEPIVAPTKGEAPVASGSHGAPEGGEGEVVTEVVGPQTVELKPFTTNLNDSSGRRFLKVSLSVEVDNQAAVDELNKMMPDIQDRILMLLSSQSMESISTVDGKERLRSQILREANTFMANNKIKKVKYSEFIIQ